MIKKKHLAAFFISGAIALAQTAPAGQSTDPSQSPRSNQTQAGAQTTDTTGSTKSSDMKKSSKTSKMSETASSTGGDSMVGSTDRTFIEKAAEGGMMEVQLAQLAEKQAASDEVKQYAQKLEQDHSAANKQLMDIAQRRGVNVPSTLKPEDQQMIDKMSKMNGTEFDREYIKHMVKDHK